MTQQTKPSTTSAEVAHRYLQRKVLPHRIPGWVSQGARHFITINALHRETAPFASPHIAHMLLQNLIVYDTLGKWHIWLAVVMPDHLHFIATFNLDIGVVRSVASWKSYQAKAMQIAFQKNFFEHRLRNDKEYVEKATYVRENPVRRGLVTRADEWPYLYSNCYRPDETSGPTGLDPAQVGRGVPAAPHAATTSALP